MSALANRPVSQKDTASIRRQITLLETEAKSFLGIPEEFEKRIALVSFEGQEGSQTIQLKQSLPAHLCDSRLLLGYAIRLASQNGPRYLRHLYFSIDLIADKVQIEVRGTDIESSLPIILSVKDISFC